MADALDSKSSSLTGVEVRLLSPLLFEAPKTPVFWGAFLLLGSGERATGTKNSPNWDKINLVLGQNRPDMTLVQLRPYSFWHDLFQKKLELRSPEICSANIGFGNVIANVAIRGQYF